jgi:hypothetical protein
MAMTQSDQAAELVTIRHFGNLGEALMAKGCLDSAGIDCFLADSNMAWLDSPLVRGMRLQVKVSDVEAAIELLESASDSNI